MATLPPTCSAQDVDVLKRSCAGDDDLASTIEVLCLSKSAAEMRQVVDDLLQADGAVAFATGLARAIGRLLADSELAGPSARGRALRVAGQCVSKAIETDLNVPGPKDLHRCLRQPSLLLALTEVVRDNRAGSGAQRAAAAALVTFCEGSPSLWKELAKEIRGNSKLLKGFLAQASSLASITDHRTQELAFEAVYRMWKVWKKQKDGPPTLPAATQSEIREGLSSISTTDFESQIRSMLASVNTRGGDGDDDGSCFGLPLSFPVEAVWQVTEWEGLGCEQHLGDAKWLDLGSDSISIQIYPKNIRRDHDNGHDAAGVFISIPADVVVTSSKLMVGTRSLRVDVPVRQCPVLARIAQEVPPKEGQSSSGSCSLAIRLGGGTRHFSRLRKALATLASTVAKDPEESPISPRAKVSVVGHTAVPATPARGGLQRPTSRDDTSLVTPRPTPRKQVKQTSRVVRSNNAKPSGSTRQQANQRKKGPIKPPLITPALDPSEGDGSTPNGMRAPDRRQKPSDLAQEKPLRKNTITASNSRVSLAVKAMAAKSFRSIAEGGMDPGGCETSSKHDDQNADDEDSWMEPRRELDLAPASGGRKGEGIAKQSSAPKGGTRQIVQPSGASSAGVSTAQGGGMWDMGDTDDEDAEGVGDLPRGGGEARRARPGGLGAGTKQARGRASGAKTAVRRSSSVGGASRGSDATSPSPRVGKSSLHSSSSKGVTSVPQRTHVREIPSRRQISASKAMSVEAEAGPKKPGRDPKKNKVAARGEATTSSSGAGSTGRGASGPRTPSAFQSKRPPKREAAAKAMQALSPSSSQSESSAEGSSQSSQEAECGGSLANLDMCESFPVGRQSNNERGEQPRREVGPSEGGRATPEIQNQESTSFAIDDLEDEEAEEQVEVAAPKKGKRPARKMAPAFNRGRSINTSPSPVGMPSNATARLRRDKNEDMQNAQEEEEREEADEHDDAGSDEVEEAASEPEDRCSDEELTEHSAPDSANTPPGSNGRREQDAAGRVTGVVVPVAEGRYPFGMDEEGEDEGGGDDDVDDDHQEEYTDEEDDSMMLARLYNKYMAGVQAREERSKKRKVDAAVEDTRQKCREYMDRTSQLVSGHWRHQVDGLLEQGRQAEEAVAAAKERVRALSLQHQAQWQASVDRVDKLASSLERMNAQLGWGAGKKTSKLEREWQGGAEALRQKLEKQRERAVARFSTTTVAAASTTTTATTVLGNPGNKKKVKNGGGGGGAANTAGGLGGGRGSNTAAAASLPSILGHLTMRTS